jgi:hypothetical protein
LGGWLWSRHALQVPLFGDALSYHQIAEAIQVRGVLTQHDYSDLRTYGYPLFLRMVLGVAGGSAIPERLLVFLVQLGFHLVAAAALWGMLDRAGVRPWAARAAVAAVAVHPLSLLFPGYLLTESLALSMGSLTLGVAVLGWARPLSAAGWLAGGLLCGAMIMVRPASIFVVPVWGLVLLQGGKRREAMALLGVVGLALPLAPQVWMNLQYFNRPTPLVAAPFGQALQTWGILHSKVKTSLIPNSNPRVTYENPFLADEGLARQDPLLWYRTHPAAGVATVLLHEFNALDQDLLLPYVTDLAPAYGPYVAGGNWAVIALGVLSWAAAWRRRSDWNPAEWGACWVSAGMMLGPMAINGGIIVESRYGLATLVPLYAWAAIGATALWRAGSGWQRWVAVGLVSLAGLAGASISHWVSEYSAAIQEVRGQPPRLPAGRQPKHPLCEGPWTSWELTRGHQAYGGVLVLQPGGQAEHPVAMEPEREYWLEFEVRGKAAQRAPLVVGLTPGGTAYEKVRLVLRGAPGARLRLEAEGEAPVRVRDVRFGPAGALPTVADWRSEDVVVTFDGTAILCAHAGSVGQLAQLVDLERNADYEVEFALRSVGPVTAPVSVDFYGGAAYDFAEQNRFLQEYGPSWEQHRIRLNAGAQAPPRAELRFVTLNEGPVEIREIEIKRR